MKYCMFEFEKEYVQQKPVSACMFVCECVGKVVK